MAAKEEDGNVNADGNLAEAGEMDELLQAISDTTDTSDSCSLGVDRSIQNISSDQGSEN
ncbi:hypothetical protein YC2023_115963 [Brassica napus]